VLAVLDVTVELSCAACAVDFVEIPNRYAPDEFLKLKMHQRTKFSVGALGQLMKLP